MSLDGTIIGYTSAYGGPMKKYISLTILLTVLSISSYATQVATDCPAMNESREKIIKSSMKKSIKSSVTKQ